MPLVDFKLCKLHDMEGNEIEANPPLHKTVANIIWRGADNLDLVEIARLINHGERVDLRGDELAEVKRLLTGRDSGLQAFARKALADFLEGVVSDGQERKG